MKGFDGYSSHDEWGSDHFGFSYGGNLRTLAGELKDKSAEFAVEPWDFVPGLWICFLSTSDGVSVDITQSRDS